MRRDPHQPIPDLDHFCHPSWTRQKGSADEDFATAIGLSWPMQRRAGFEDARCALLTDVLVAAVDLSPEPPLLLRPTANPSIQPCCHGGPITLARDSYHG